MSWIHVCRSVTLVCGTVCPQIVVQRPIQASQGGDEKPVRATNVRPTTPSSRAGIYGVDLWQFTAFGLLYRVAAVPSWAFPPRQ